MQRLRVTFSRGDSLKFISHLDMMRLWQRALRRADIPLLVFEFDMFDPRITPYEDIYFEVERFVNEIVWPRKMRGRERARARE